MHHARIDGNISVEDRGNAPRADCLQSILEPLLIPQLVPKAGYAPASPVFQTVALTTIASLTLIGARRRFAFTSQDFTPALQKTGHKLERTAGIKPAPFAWQANILSLNYVRIRMVGNP